MANARDDRGAGGIRDEPRGDDWGDSGAGERRGEGERCANDASSFFAARARGRSGGGRTRALASTREEAPSPGRGFAKRRRVETRRAARSRRARPSSARLAPRRYTWFALSSSPRFDGAKSALGRRFRTSRRPPTSPRRRAGPPSARPPWCAIASRASGARDATVRAREGASGNRQKKATPHVFVVNFSPRLSALLIFRGDW